MVARGDGNPGDLTGALLVEGPSHKPGYDPAEFDDCAIVNRKIPLNLLDALGVEPLGQRQSHPKCRIEVAFCNQASFSGVGRSTRHRVR